MKKRLDLMGIMILIVLFISFYFITTLFLDNIKHDETIKEEESAIEKVDPNYDDEKDIVSRLYQDVRILYDVVNNKFRVSQEDTIVIGNITYKRIVNFDSVMGHLFTDNGIDNYINLLGSYFAYTDSGYYLAGNLVSYQTYYFRGDKTNIYVIDASDNYIKAIIYEKWSSNNKNTLAMIEVVNNGNKWLVDNIDILATE